MTHDNGLWDLFVQAVFSVAVTVFTLWILTMIR